MASFLRPARSLDQPAIARMVRSAGLLPFGLDWPRFLVAESAGRIVGVGQIKVHRDGSHEIASLAVLEEHRRRGIGSVLVRALLGRTDRPIYVICPAHLEVYYGRFGFRRAAARDLAPYFLAVACAARLVGLARRLRGRRRDVLILRRAGGRTG
jgi:N-acetylglutamate synthase-like GNAT family acetyltransferase